MKISNLFIVAFIVSMTSFNIHATGSAHNSMIRFSGNIVASSCSTLHATGTNKQNGYLSCWQTDVLSEIPLTIDYYSEKTVDSQLIKSISHKKISDSASHYIINYK